MPCTISPSLPAQARHPLRAVPGGATGPGPEVRRGQPWVPPDLPPHTGRGRGCRTRRPQTGQPTGKPLPSQLLEESLLNWLIGAGHSNDHQQWTQSPLDFSFFSDSSPHALFAFSATNKTAEPSRSQPCGSARLTPRQSRLRRPSSCPSPLSNPNDPRHMPPG